MSTVPTANDMYRIAQMIALGGQPVFPCKAFGDKAKAPYTRHGFEDASCDKAQLKAWWRQFGNAAVGIPTGIVYDVLDVDVKNAVDGRVHLPRLKELGLLNGCKRVIQTPSGGWHLYFNAAPALTANRASAALGLDVRGLGGYVLASGSYIESGAHKGFYVDHGETTDSTDEPLLWNLVASSLAPANNETKKPVTLLPSDRQSSVAALREWMTTLKPGERNNGLHWAVCRCIESGIDPHEMVEPALLIGLREDETLLTVRSALTRAGLAAEELMDEAETLFPEEVGAGVGAAA